MFNTDHYPPKDLERATEVLMLEVGIPDHLLGYEYIKFAIAESVKDNALPRQITFVLYPLIATRFSTNASRVERAIRHAIEVTFESSDPEVLMHYFGNTISPRRGKPTNAQFIARMANIIRARI